MLISAEWRKISWRFEQTISVTTGWPILSNTKPGRFGAQICHLRPFCTQNDRSACFFDLPRETRKNILPFCLFSNVITGAIQSPTQEQETAYFQAQTWRAVHSSLQERNTSKFNVASELRGSHTGNYLCAFGDREVGGTEVANRFGRLWCGKAVWRWGFSSLGRPVIAAHQRIAGGRTLYLKRDQADVDMRGRKCFTVSRFDIDGSKFLANSILKSLEIYRYRFQSGWIIYESELCISQDREVRRAQIVSPTII